MSIIHRSIITVTFGTGALLLAFGACNKTADGDAAGGYGSGSERCEPLCEAFHAADCDHSVSLDSCMVTCLALTGSPACETEGNSYFDCAEGVNVECSTGGDPYFPGCGPAYLIAVGCAVTEDPNPAVEQPCDEYCDNVVAPGCENANPKSECMTNCLWLGASGTDCDDEWLDYLDCANAADWSCVLGYPVPSACGTPFTAYYACLDAVGT